MAFEKRDADALNQAHEKHFAPISVDVGDHQVFLMKLEVQNVVTIDAPAKRLADAMNAASRFYNDGNSTTVWLDITATEIPSFVAKAIEQIAGLPLGLVVTHGVRCSHPPGAHLPEQLLAATRDVQRDGWIWHPIENRRVPSRSLNT